MTYVRHTYTVDDDVKILDGHAAELTWQEIAESLPGLSARQVRMRAARIGVHHCRKVKDEMQCPKKPTRDLLLALEGQFISFSRQQGVDYLDARTLLMDGRLAV